MYNVGDEVSYKCPRKQISSGKIISKHNILDSVCVYEIGKILYRIEYDARCCLDDVVEEDIIGK